MESQKTHIIKRHQKKKAGGIKKYFLIQDRLQIYSNQKRQTGRKTYKEQRDRRRCPRISPYAYNQLIFDQSAEKINGRNDSIFKWCWETEFIYVKEQNRSVKLKWIRELYVRP